MKITVLDKKGLKYKTENLIVVLAEISEEIIFTEQRDHIDDNYYQRFQRAIAPCFTRILESLIPSVLQAFYTPQAPDKMDVVVSPLEPKKLLINMVFEGEIIQCLSKATDCASAVQLHISISSGETITDTYDSFTTYEIYTEEKLIN